MPTSRENNQDTNCQNIDTDKDISSHSVSAGQIDDAELENTDSEDTKREEQKILDSEGSTEGKDESVDDIEEEFIETCTCGHSRKHHLVTPRPTYTAWGTFWITIMGVSATPIRVDFICRICNEKFDFEIDPERLKDFY